jgi:hypothetical protein
MQSSAPLEQRASCTLNHVDVARAQRESDYSRQMASAITDAWFAQRQVPSIIVGGLAKRRIRVDRILCPRCVHARPNHRLQPESLNPLLGLVQVPVFPQGQRAPVCA